MSSKRSHLWKELIAITKNKPPISWCNSNASQIQIEINKIKYGYENELEKEIIEWIKIGQMNLKDEIEKQAEIYRTIMTRVKHEYEEQAEIYRTIMIKKERKNRNKNEDNCSICLDQMRNNNIILPCNHKFHNKCIKKLFITFHDNKCPLCRAKYKYPVR